MKRQNFNVNIKTSLLKQLYFGFLVPSMLICWSAILGTTSASAQKLTTVNTTCNVSVQARYECFLKVQKDSQVKTDTSESTLYSQKKIRQEAYFKDRQGSLEKAKKKGAVRKSISDAKDKLRLESIESPEKQREKNHREIMEQVMYSRSRNISHKGERYSITYGYVLEPGP